MSCNLLDLSTELLIHIFGYLPVTDLFSIQQTCRRNYAIVAETTYLQYIIHTQLNGVDDLLPPNCPFSERLELLRQHEKSWNDLQLNLYTEFSTNFYFRKNIIQDGYLIFRSNTDLTRYGYVDLFALSPKEEPHQIQISLNNFQIPYNLVFSVENDLAVAIRLGGLPITLTITLLTSHREKGTSTRLVQHQLAFFEFTTGAPHPLSAAHTKSLPLVDYLGVIRVEVEFLGDHILATAVHHHGRSSFYLVSWKTGTVTFLGGLPGTPKLTVIDRSFVLLIRESINTLEIHKLEITSSPPRMKTVCSLELPPLKPDALIFSSMFSKECIASSERRAGSQFSRRRLPFRSSRIDTVTLRLSYRTPESGIRPPGYAFIFSVTALLSVAHSGVRKVSWEKWGPLGTRILPCTDIVPAPAGPFWVICVSPLIVHDYDPLRAVHIPSIAENPSPQSGLPIFASTKVVGKHWKSREVETRLPYREFASKDTFLDPSGIVGEREWIVVISPEDGGTHFAVYHVG
ncbi:hypothetical protein EDB86DRAFT_2988868 [Lactarius hatsudake]|nr:hypothetical protein EDB86DRAFT_2988868 [Lactarius hatsudake]